MIERLYKTDEVAEMFGVQPETIRDWIAAGKLKGVKLGKRWRVTESEVKRFAQVEYGGSDAPAANDA